MIEQWVQLRGRLMNGNCWSSCDKVKAIRLLGKQPSDAINDPAVATIFIASHADNPVYDSPFAEVQCDVPGPQFRIYNNMATQRAPDLGMPNDAYDAALRGREILKNFVEEAIGRLQKKAEAHTAKLSPGAAMAPAYSGSTQP